MWRLHANIVHLLLVRHSMKGFSISGSWRGTYWYAPGSDEARVCAGTAFILELKQGWFGAFSGIVQDDPEQGYAGTGEIRGRLNYPNLRFLKRLPDMLCMRVDGKSETLPELLARHGVQSVPHFAHPPLIYTGTFYDGDHAEGLWELLPTVINVQGQFVSLQGSKGTWSIERG